MPAGELETVPDPLPDLATVSARVCSVNVAVTARAWSIVTVQPPVPVHAPLQPLKSEPVTGVGVRVTLAASSNEALQVAPHVNAAGELDTDPDPLPLFETVRAQIFTNVAVTDLFASIVSVQPPVPLHPPLHPANLDPAAGVAVSVTLAPSP